MNLRSVLASLAGVLTIGVGSWALLGARPSASTSFEAERFKPPTEWAAISAADHFYASAKYDAATAAFEAFVEEHRENSDPFIQDGVAVARIRLGYLASKEGDFATAKTRFIEASRDYRGTSHSSEYGTLPQQADYQAAVCRTKLSPNSAAAQLEVFIEKNPLSPMTHAAFRRLQALNGGVATPRQEALMQAAVTKREKHLKWQLALCGPKAVLEVMRRHSLPLPSAEEVASKCETTDKGTTMTGMVRGLEAYGFAGTGYELAARDLHELPLPSIWLNADHYLVILKVDGRRFEVYDPVGDTVEWQELPQHAFDTLTLKVIKVTRKAS